MSKKVLTVDLNTGKKQLETIIDDFNAMGRDDITYSAKAIDNMLSDLVGNVSEDGNTLEKLRELITNIQSLLDTGGLDLSALQQMIDYFSNNKDLIEEITNNKVNISDIIDDLIHMDIDKPLSANQGLILKNLIDEINNNLSVVAKSNNYNDLTNLPDLSNIVIESDFETRLKQCWIVVNNVDEMNLIPMQFLTLGKVVKVLDVDGEEKYYSYNGTNWDEQTFGGSSSSINVDNITIQGDGITPLSVKQIDISNILEETLTGDSGILVTGIKGPMNNISKWDEVGNLIDSEVNLDNVVLLDRSQILTNKTIDISKNTVSNLTISNFNSNAILFGTETVDNSKLITVGYFEQHVYNALNVQGNWDALNNVPDITSFTQSNCAWIVSVAGNIDMNGIIDWKINDWIVKTDIGWAKISNSLNAMAWGNIYGNVLDQIDLKNELDNKQSIITGAATTITNTDLSINKVVITDINGKISSSEISSIELDSLSGITTNIQEQLNLKGIGSVVNITSTNSDIIISNNITNPQLTINSGIAANQLLKLDENGKIPAVDASQLLNLPKSGHSIENNDIPIPFQSKLNFIGTGVSVEDDMENDSTNVTINGLACYRNDFSITDWQGVEPNFTLTYTQDQHNQGGTNLLDIVLFEGGDFNDRVYASYKVLLDGTVIVNSAVKFDGYILISNLNSGGSNGGGGMSFLIDTTQSINIPGNQISNFDIPILYSKLEIKYIKVINGSTSKFIFKIFDIDNSVLYESLQRTSISDMVVIPFDTNRTNKISCSICNLNSNNVDFKVIIRGTNLN